VPQRRAGAVPAVQPDPRPRGWDARRPPACGCLTATWTLTRTR